MAGNEDARDCPECGAPRPGEGVCPACGARPHAIELKVLPRDGHAGPVRPEVKLVRQLKMPTVEHLVSDPGVADLPGAMRSVEDALQDGDLAAADELLDHALGAVLEGPGHERRAGMQWRFLPAVLWVWCGLLVVLYLLSLLV